MFLFAGEMMQQNRDIETMESSSVLLERLAEELQKLNQGIIIPLPRWAE